MINPSQLLLWGTVLLALGFFVPDPWGEVMKLASILLCAASIYYDIRAWARRRDKK